MLKKTSEGKIKKEKPKDETPSKKVQEEKNKKSVSTPRNFLQKTSAADIYGLKNKSSAQGAKAPVKSSNASYKSSNVSPMRDFLKSSPSSISQLSRTSDRKVEKRVEAKAIHSARKTSKTTLPLANVTVNSPIVKRKLNLERENTGIKKADKSKLERENTKPTKEVASKLEPDTKKEREITKSTKEVASKSEISTRENSKIVLERQRTKTRTLDENEVKILTPDVVDNNAEMLNLSRKLVAKPKVFYVDLDGESRTKNDKASDEEISYEDDFESYESDFESYHSETNERSSDGDGNGDHNEDDPDGDGGKSDDLLESDLKEVRDEERMLDSGSYDLRDRSAKAKPSVMEHILEDAEDPSDKGVSLTDEGFQEMSSSSAVSSMKTVHVDVLDRPLFIDFTKSKETKRKRRLFERLKKRADELLSMITLHDMSYTLFEMKPISYDLFMATFGRQNYTQTSVQTFDDGVSEEIQTEEIPQCHKWTQNPVEFSQSDIYLYHDVFARKYSVHTVDYLTKFTFLTENKCDGLINDRINLDENYKTNPLRIYFEQKDGAGFSEMLPYESYKSKLRNNHYNSNRLRKFLKKIESRISNVLSVNAGNTEFTDLVESAKLPFSGGYVSISSKNVSDEKFSFLSRSKITQVFFSENKSNLLLTVHEKSQISRNKCIVCLWDISIAKREPAKILHVIDDIIIGRFRGSTDGIFVSALEDGSIHLWDLSDEAKFYDDTASKEETTNSVVIHSEELTEFERDIEWNLKSSHVGTDQLPIHCALQACAYTTSACNMNNGDVLDRIVGLELTTPEAVHQEGGRKVIGQVVSLQRIGMLTFYSLIQEKTSAISKDIGKAYWSRVKLEKSQIISVNDHFDVRYEENLENIANFNLTAAKRRLSNRKQEKSVTRKVVSRPKSAISSDFEFDIDRPASAASASSKKSTKMMPTEKNVLRIWENGVVCNDLKIMRLRDVDNYLVAKNCGEVLCCRKTLGAVKVQRFCVANDSSSVTCLAVSADGLPYFLAATDSGTVTLCSLLENRVLLTLDCRNVPSTQDTTERCQADHKGRYISSVSSRPSIGMQSKISVTSLLWSPVNPCCIYALLRDGAVVAWDLTHSDIYGQCASERARALVASYNSLALLTHEGEVQIHRLANEQRSKNNLELFGKYVALL